MRWRDDMRGLHAGARSPGGGGGMQSAGYWQVHEPGGWQMDAVRRLRTGARSPEGVGSPEGGGMGCTACGRLHGVQRVEGWGAQVGSLCKEPGGWRDAVRVL